jgi:anti-anti-sigma factor
VASDAPRPAHLDVAASEGTETVLALRGDLDPATVPQLEAAITAAAEAGAVERIVLDLAGLTFLDSSGLRTFVTARESLAGDGIQLALRRPTSNVVRLLDVTGLAEIIDVE